MGRTEAVLVSMTSSPSGRTHNAVEGGCSKGTSDRVRKKAITSDNSSLVMPDSLDEKGFFKDEDLRTAATLPFSRWDIGRATIAVRSLDPPGVGARSLCDSLIIQARRKKNCPPHTLQLLKNHYDNFLNGQAIGHFSRRLSKSQIRL